MPAQDADQTAGRDRAVIWVVGSSKGVITLSLFFTVLISLCTEEHEFRFTSGKG